MPDLKPCPFCELPAQRGEGAAAGFFRCPDMQCPGHNWARLDRWNTRAPAQPSEGIREVVKTGLLWIEKNRVSHPGSKSFNERVEAQGATTMHWTALLRLTPAEREACGVEERQHAE